MPQPRPTFSLVTAVYNVEAYLPDFIRSIEGQTFGTSQIEVVAVDDGSTDASLALLEAWRERCPELVRIISQANAGQGAARNAGLVAATGTWVTFTDPDDMLDPAFFAVADAFAASHGSVKVMASKPLMFDEAHNRVRDRHARRGQYAAGNRVVDLRRYPVVFTGSSTVSIYRLDEIRRQGLAFDSRIRPTFEDGHFAARFVLGIGDPLIGVLRDARYLYRQRRSLNSTMQVGWEQPGRYSTIFDLGFLDLIERAKSAFGSVPAWLQNLLLYELSFYLIEDAAISSKVRLAPEMADAFHDRFAAVVRELDPGVITGFTLRVFQPATIDLLLHGFRDDPWRPTAAERTKADTMMGLTRLVYRYHGSVPSEAITVGGRQVKPAFAKIRPVTFFGRTMLQERIVWIPSGPDIVLVVDGAMLAIVDAPLPKLGRPPAIRPVAVKGRASLRDRLRQRSATRALTAKGRRIAIRIRLGLIAARRGYRDAWVLMDRVDDADDNGERLFEYLQASRPDINAWFVLERGSADWKRLRGAGVRRLVAYGTRDYRALMLHASWLVSSHADRAIVQPKALDRALDRPTWHVAFLQHGVIKDDLSAWLNTRDIDLFVTSTGPELASIADDGTAYRFTSKEASNTGLPRFDRLLAKGMAVPESERTLVIVAPTWRRYLTTPPEIGTQKRELVDLYWGSPYEVAWSAVLRSPEIAEALSRRGWRLGFMPHPNVQPVLADMDLPAHVERLSFTDTDVQGLYGRCALLVTDYSSVAFNAAYLDRPVVYYQFDRDDVEAGAHIGRKGYFEYERDGFGPVALTHEAAVAEIVAAIEAGRRPSPVYQERIDRTFVTRDGRACERVVAAIEERSRPYRAPEAAGREARG